MINTSKQLKDKVRNISKGDNNVAMTLFRRYMMERFLERVSVSKYRKNFILKGGMLVSAIVGVDMRATMDIDTTVKALSLNEKDIERILLEICGIDIEDNVTFEIKSIANIMTEFEYPGIRVMLEAKFENIRQTIKLDISTDDIITPSAIEFDYKLMFEDGKISLFTYNIETLLAEKIQTILARGIANTRMRDFYDVYSIKNMNLDKIDIAVLCEAFEATCRKRETIFTKKEMTEIIRSISNDDVMMQQWQVFRKKNFYVGNLKWEDMMVSVIETIECII